MTGTFEIIRFSEDLSRDVIDEQTGVIRGCKIVGLESKKGRSYTPDALRRAIPMYEGVVVNLDHKGGDRSFADRFGRFRNVRFEADRGLFGDLHFNPAHPMAKTVIWWARNDPKAAGFSHVVKGRKRMSGTTEVIEDIQAVDSVDLVANPATTGGMFESTANEPPMSHDPFERESFGPRLEPDDFELAEIQSLQPKPRSPESEYYGPRLELDDFEIAESAGRTEIDPRVFTEAELKACARRLTR